MKKKGGIEGFELTWWILILLGIGISVFLILLFGGKLGPLGEYLGDLFKFR